MKLWSFGQKREEPILVFHIGSSKISGAVCTTDPSGSPRILFSASESVPIENTLDVPGFLVKAVQALDRVAAEIHAKRPGAFTRAFVVLSSPWYASETREISLKKNTPFIFTEKLADELLQKEIKRMGEHQPLSGEEAIRTIELKNIKTLLNGYEVPEPLYKKCRELHMTLFISMSSESALRKIEEAIGKHFQVQRIKFSSFAVASFTVVRDVWGKRENFLLVDIGGEVTDVFMVKKNVLRSGVSFPYGHNFLIRGTAESLGSTLGEAASLLSLYRDGHAAESLLKRLGPVIKKLRTEWLKKFQESLINITSEISLPGNVYVTSEGSFTDLFSELIRAEEFTQYTSAESKFEIVQLDAKALHALAAFDDDALRDPALIIDSVYINRFLATI